METEAELRASAKALVEMYQAGWYDAYCMKKQKKPLWKNVRRKCELSFNKRFPTIVEKIEKIQNI